jgi:hypothetical protein
MSRIYACQHPFLFSVAPMHQTLQPLLAPPCNTPALNGRSACKASTLCDAPRCRVFFAREVTLSRIFFAEALLTHTRSKQSNARCTLSFGLAANAHMQDAHDLDDALPLPLQRFIGTGQAWPSAQSSVDEHSHLNDSQPTDADAVGSVCEGTEVRAHVSFPGGTFETSRVSTVAQCCAKCITTKQSHGCTHWTLRGDDCRLKTSGSGALDGAPPPWDKGVREEASTDGTSLMSGWVVGDQRAPAAADGIASQLPPSTALNKPSADTPAGGARATACTGDADVTHRRTDADSSLAAFVARLPPPLSGGALPDLTVDRSQQSVDVCGNIATSHPSNPQDSTAGANVTREPCVGRPLRGPGRRSARLPMCTWPQSMLDRKKWINFTVAEARQLLLGKTVVPPHTHARTHATTTTTTFTVYSCDKPDHYACVEARS